MGPAFTSNLQFASELFALSKSSFLCSYHKAMRTVSAAIVISVWPLRKARAALSDCSLLDCVFQCLILIV